MKPLWTKKDFDVQCIEKMPLHSICIKVTVLGTKFHRVRNGYELISCFVELIQKGKL